MKKVFLLVCVLALSACSTAMTAYEATAIDAVKRADDNKLGLQVVGLCATPYSAAIRNPQVIPGLRALCLGAGNEAAPAALFEQLTIPPFVVPK